MTVSPTASQAHVQACNPAPGSTLWAEQDVSGMFACRMVTRNKALPIKESRILFRASDEQSSFPGKSGEAAVQTGTLRQR